MTGGGIIGTEEMYVIACFIDFVDTGLPVDGSAS